MKNIGFGKNQNKMITEKKEQLQGRNKDKMEIQIKITIDEMLEDIYN